MDLLVENHLVDRPIDFDKYCFVDAHARLKSIHGLVQ